MAMKYPSNQKINLGHRKATEPQNRSQKHLMFQEKNKCLCKTKMNFSIKVKTTQSKQHLENNLQNYSNFKYRLRFQTSKILAQLVTETAVIFNVIAEISVD